MVKLIIKGTIIGCNEYIRLCRGNKYVAAKAIKAVEEDIKWQIKAQIKTKITKPVIMHYLWIRQNSLMDCSNIAFSKKFIEDSLVQLGILKDDSQKYVKGFTDHFSVDKKNPRIEIVFEEVD